MVHFDKIIGAGALALGLLTVAGMLSTDAYLHGAKAEARGYDALTKLIVNDHSKVCLNDVAPESQNDQTVAQ